MLGSYPDHWLAGERAHLAEDSLATTRVVSRASRAVERGREPEETRARTIRSFAVIS